ncbi:MAG: YkvA family protein [Candidatus Fermentibacteria bacterium]|nr:YkvA family protein [Candidatus Fermentibacteria bacterium]
MRKTISKKTAERVVNDGASRVTEEDMYKVVDRADDIQRKVSPNGPLGRFINDVKLMISLVKDYWNKNYREVPWWTVAAVVASLLYVLSPVDLIPDFIPFFGLLDDAAVVSACLFLVEQDLSRYKIWKDMKSQAEKMDENDEQ